ncbi:hypothetical protein IC607_00890 [Cellulomonas sp. JH27-2]|uniref:hypothetical protein n=1 Tax=Cellulomonas sp. JH27-2 TaxID=2774139 RepID=UPI00177EA80A|nr:hypothetical protein [Cellulomonas sp. JH27-2]MBD8057525.1 hypothetical protein [Cellulomonas sp. JH27-2]
MLYIDDLPGGPFDMFETYVEYDGPKTFALSSSFLPILYFVNAVDEVEESGAIVAVAVAVDRQRFNAVRAGVVTFRDAFLEASDTHLYTFEWLPELDDSGVPHRFSRARPAILIPDHWLPAAHARLDIATNTVDEFQERNLLALSAAQHQTLFALEVEAPGLNVTAFPARNSGHLQIATHGVFDALAREVAPGSDVIRDLYPAVLDLQAASFVIVMGVEMRAAMLEPVETSGQIVDGLSDLVDSVGSDDSSSFISTMHQHSQRARNRFRDLLESIAPVNSGLAVTTAKPGAESTRKAVASSSQVKLAIQALDDEQPEIEMIEVTRGVLMGLVIRLRRFEIVDLATGVRYKGRMTEEAVQQANGFSVGDESFVAATIRAEVEFASRDETAGAKYWLQSIAQTGETVSADDERDAFGADVERGSSTDGF